MTHYPFSAPLTQTIITASVAHTIQTIIKKTATPDMLTLTKWTTFQWLGVILAVRDDSTDEH